jgi:hypothetical protein
VIDYGKKYLNNADFKNNYLGYFEQALGKKVNLAKEPFFVPTTVESAIKHITDTILAALSNPQKEEKIAAISQILKQEKVNLFGEFEALVQKRITAKERGDDYRIKPTG